MAAALTAAPLLTGAPATADSRVTASVDAYERARDKYEAARAAYAAKPQQKLTEWRVVSALYTAATVNLSQAKRNIRDQFRRDIAAANSTYRAAAKVAKTAAAKAAAIDTWNAAKAQEAITRDADLNSLRALSAMPARPLR
ncbi:MAG: hypothetical protein RL745_882 [Actinomycetota bacterium]|jgi:hypothetical protein